MEVRPEAIRDRSAVRAVHAAAFGERRGIELLSERDVPLVFLEGAPGYYSRFGFEPGAAHGFRKPSLRIPDAAFQVLRLPTYESWMTGTLVYAEAFWRHDAVGRRDPKA